MTILGNQLELSRCPHCNVDTPQLTTSHSLETRSSENKNRRIWRIYKCNRCGGIVTAAALEDNQPVIEIYPGSNELDEAIPEKARVYLAQAISSLSAPAGAIMLSASSVDALLKAKGYRDGSLHERVNLAASDHLITSGMAKWAHQVRLDGNGQRHADEDEGLPTAADALKSIRFVQALAEFMFVLPSRVDEGIEDTAPTTAVGSA